MHNVMAYWIPMTLSEKQRKARIDCATDLLHVLTDLGDDRYDLYAVEDETWIRHVPEHTRQTARVWKSKKYERPQVTFNSKEDIGYDRTNSQ